MVAEMLDVPPNGSLRAACRKRSVKGSISSFPDRANARARDGYQKRVKSFSMISPICTNSGNSTQLVLVCRQQPVALVFSVIGINDSARQ